MPGQLCSSVILTSGPISLAQTAKNCRTGPSRLDHQLTTFLGPDLGKVAKEARLRKLAEYQLVRRSNYLIGLASIGSVC